MYLVHLRIGSIDLPGVRVVGQPKDAEIILGRNVLNRLSITLNGPAEVTEISGTTSER
jgi:hypothetical protein